MAMCPHLKYLLIYRRLQQTAGKLQILSSVKPLLASPRLPQTIPECKVHVQYSVLPSSRTCHAPVASSTCRLTSRLNCDKYLTIFERTLFTTSACHKRKQQVASDDEETDEETGEEEKYDSDVETDDSDDEEDESGVPKDYKDIRHDFGSLRIDAVLSKGLNISRKKVEDDFLSTKFRLNGTVVTKKGRKVKVGDTLDLVRGPSDGDDMKSVMRLVVKNILPDKTAKGNIRVVLRRWKNLKVPKSQL